MAERREPTRDATRPMEELELLPGESTETFREAPEYAVGEFVQLVDTELTEEDRARTWRVIGYERDVHGEPVLRDGKKVVLLEDLNGSLTSKVFEDQIQALPINADMAASLSLANRIEGAKIRVPLHGVWSVREVSGMGMLGEGGEDDVASSTVALEDAEQGVSVTVEMHPKLQELLGNPKSIKALEAIRNVPIRLNGVWEITRVTGSINPQNIQEAVLEIQNLDGLTVSITWENLMRLTSEVLGPDPE